MKIVQIFYSLLYLSVLVTQYSSIIWCAHPPQSDSVWHDDVLLNEQIQVKCIENKIDYTDFKLVDITTLQNKLIMLGEGMGPAGIKLPLIGSVGNIGSKSDIVIFHYDGLKINNVVVCEKIKPLGLIKLTIINNKPIIVAPVNNETQWYTTETPWPFKKKLNPLDTKAGDLAIVGSDGTEFWLCKKPEKKCTFFSAPGKEQQLSFSNQPYIPSLVSPSSYTSGKNIPLDEQEKYVIYWTVYHNELHKLYKLPSGYVLSSSYKNQFVRNFLQIIPYTPNNAIALCTTAENEKNKEIIHISLNPTALDYSTTTLETPQGIEKIALVSETNTGATIKKLYCLTTVDDAGYTTTQIKVALLDTLIKKTTLEKVQKAVATQVVQNKSQSTVQEPRDMTSNSSNTTTPPPVAPTITIQPAIPNPITPTTSKTDTSPTTVSINLINTDQTTRTPPFSTSTAKDSIKYTIKPDAAYIPCITSLQDNLLILKENNTLLCVGKDQFADEIIRHENCLTFNIYQFLHKHITLRDNTTIEYIYKKDDTVYLFIKKGKELFCYTREMNQSSTRTENTWRFVSKKTLPNTTTKIMGIRALENTVVIGDEERKISYEGILFLSEGCFFRDKTSFDFGSIVKFDTSNCGHYKDISLYDQGYTDYWILNSTHEIHAMHENSVKKIYTIDPQYSLIKLVAISSTEGFGLTVDGTVYRLTLVDTINQQGAVIAQKLLYDNEVIYAQTIVPDKNGSIGIITKENEILDISAQYLTVTQEKISPSLSINHKPPSIDTTITDSSTGGANPSIPPTSITPPISTTHQEPGLLSYFNYMAHNISFFAKKYIMNPIITLWRSLWAPY